MYKRISSLLIIFLLFFSDVLSVQVPIINTQDDKALLFADIPQKVIDSEYLSGKGLKNYTKEAPSFAELSSIIKETSATDNVNRYVLFTPKVDNTNNINVTPKVVTTLDSCQFNSLVMYMEQNLKSIQNDNEEDVLFKIGVLEAVEQYLKEQEDKNRLEATVNLIWLLSFIISIVSLCIHRVKQDRLLQSIIALILVASFVMFIINLPNMIYYFG